MKGFFISKPTLRKVRDFKKSGNYYLTVINGEEYVVSEDDVMIIDSVDSVESNHESTVTNPSHIPCDFIWVEGGSFEMGCDPDRDGKGHGDEKPLHSVTLGSFAMAKHELTYGEFKAFMQATDYQCSAEGASDKHPVVNVTWYDAVNYCNWRSKQEGLEEVYQINGAEVVWNPLARGYRLPTEAEWEYAARGGQQSRGYRYAGSNAIEEVAWYEDNSGGRVQPVGQKPANELGLQDMSGNVWEWCWDWYGRDYYAAANEDNPTGPGAGEHRVLRGGSWYSDPENCRLAFRHHDSPDDGFSDYGFRLVL